MNPKKTTQPVRPELQLALLFGLAFLLFFQLVSDFVESIYTFGLLGTSIPPEIVSVVFFFSSALLLFFRRGLSYRGALVALALAAVLHGVEVSVDPRLKLLASGVGVGCVFLLFPALLAVWNERDEAVPLSAGLGLTSALLASVLLRAVGRGSDLTLVWPWLGWVEATAALLLAGVAFRQRDGAIGSREPAGSTGSALAYSLGVMGALSVLYFAVASPGVMARWAAVDLRWVFGFLAVGVGGFLAALSARGAGWITKPLLLAWNVFFLLCGVTAILSNQVAFPGDPAQFPLSAPDLALWQQIPLFLMLLSSPVALANVAFLFRAVAASRVTPRALAGGFLLGGLFLLVIVLAQAFTTVYDYIPVVGPWLRDRFWLVFLLAGLGMALPLLKTPGGLRIAPGRLPKSGLAALSLAAVVPLAWAWASAPALALPAAGDSLRVLTYNIQQGYSEDGQRNYAGQLELIRGYAPDIVGLQESDTARFSGGNADVVRTIADGLGMHAYYGPKTVTGTFGIALLSRYPIENARTFYMYSVGEQTAAIEAQITVGATPFHVLVTHLGNGGPIIQQQQVLARLAGQRNVIAMGDFNFRPDTEQYALTTRSLQDGWLLGGASETQGFDANRRIDHVFVSEGVDVHAAQYIVSPASDHPALFVEVALP